MWETGPLPSPGAPALALAVKATVLAIFFACSALLVFTDVQPRGFLWATAAVATLTEVVLEYMFLRRNDRS